MILRCAQLRALQAGSRGDAVRVELKRPRVFDDRAIVIQTVFGAARVPENAGRRASRERVMTISAATQRLTAGGRARYRPPARTTSTFRGI